MELKWTLAAQSAASGIVGVSIVIAIRLWKKMRPIITLPQSFLVFTGFLLVPSIPVLCMFPFVEPKPDLREHAAYLVVAGFSLIWLVYETFRQGLK